MSNDDRDSPPRGDAPREDRERRDGAPATADAQRARGTRDRPDAVTEEYREIQREVDRADQRSPQSGGKEQSQQAAQVGARAEPAPPLPKRHQVKPEELSPIYVFLASPVCSSCITGEIYPVIGGYTSR